MRSIGSFLLRYSFSLSLSPLVLLHLSNSFSTLSDFLLLFLSHLTVPTPFLMTLPGKTMTLANHMHVNSKNNIHNCKSNLHLCPLQRMTDEISHKSNTAASFNLLLLMLLLKANCVLHLYHYVSWALDMICRGESIIIIIIIRFAFPEGNTSACKHFK